MKHSEAHLSELIMLVSNLSKKDEGFRNNLHKACFGEKSSIQLVNEVPVSDKKLDWLLEYFGINIATEELLNFNFLKEDYPFLQQQLFFDQIHMLRAHYGIGQENGKPNFREYCSIAHLQIEGLINCYFEKLQNDRSKFLNSIIFNNTKVVLDKEDRSPYQGILHKNKQGEYSDIYYKDLSPRLNHKAKYYEEAKRNTQYLITYNSKKWIFKTMHQFDAKRLGLIPVPNFGFSESVYAVRNSEYHRGVNGEKLNSKNESVNDFINNSDFIGVYRCLQEITIVVQDAFSAKVKT